MSVRTAVLNLIAYGIRTGLIEPLDSIFAANQIYDVLGLEPDYDFDPEYSKLDMSDETPLEDILGCLLDDAVARGKIDGGIASRDLFDTRIMGCLTPRPSDVNAAFWRLYEESPEKATDYFYKLSRDSDYIRTYRIKKDRKWLASTRYGDLDITINLSKPEKDPKAIAAALSRKQQQYPLCLLCPSNTGYAGRLDHPARQTIRLIPLTLDGAQWYMQYSPYVYYNEHCIVLSGEHVPMKIERSTFVRLLEFIKTFPHYTVGSNADLPIVGGSILTHEHFQGGRYEFAMERAGIRKEISFAGFEDIEAGIVEWPMSVIRLDGTDPDRIVELSDRILTAWRAYSDPENDIFAETDGTPHNTITPIARMRGGKYELDKIDNDPPLAAIEDMEYKDEKIVLRPGDSVFLYTDGVPDAKSSEGKRFGTDRMVYYLNEYADLPPKELVTGLKQQIDDFSGDSPFDDVTMLCINYSGKQK